MSVRRNEGDALSSLLRLFDAWAVRERASARARHIRVEIRHDGEVVLTIPRRASRAAAYAFLQRQRVWIERTRQRLLAARMRTPPLRWDGTDTISLRGAPVPLTVETLPGRGSRAVIELGSIRLRVPAPRRHDHRHLRQLLLTLLRDEARRDAERLLGEEAARLGLRQSDLSLRDMRSRWGSCGPDGRISLSLRLVMAPPEVFRYVVIHELCHRRWRSHGPRFWALVARQMPDYQTHRSWLRREGGTLLAWELRR